VSEEWKSEGIYRQMSFDAVSSFVEAESFAFLTGNQTGYKGTATDLSGVRREAYGTGLRPTRSSSIFNWIPSATREIIPLPR